MPKPFDPVLIGVIGSRISQARHACGMTQAQLAERVGIEPVTLSRYETGSRSPSITTLAQLAAATATPLAALVDEAQPMPDRGHPPEVEKGIRVLEELPDGSLPLALELLDALKRHS